MYGAAKARFFRGAIFVREWLKSPCAMGTICPGGVCLAQAMAARAGHGKNGLVIELGAGTGCVTGALRKAGVAPERL